MRSCRILAIPALVCSLFALSSAAEDLPGGSDNLSKQAVSSPVSQALPAWYFDASSWRMREGDDKGWAAVALDDSDWTLPKSKDGVFSEGPFVDVSEGIFWVRVKVVITSDWVQRHIDSLFHEIKGAREIYWDGEKIGGTGTVGVDRESEIPGLNVHWVPIPERLLGIGEHQIAIRLSSHYDKALDGPILHSIKLTDDSYEIPIDLSNIYVARYMFGFACGVCVIFLLIYLFAERTTSYFLFSLLSGLFAMAMYSAFYEFSHPENFTYYDDARRRAIALLCVFVISLLLPTFFLTHFSLKRKALHVGWIGLALLIVYYSIPYQDLRLYLHLGIGNGSATLFAVYAAWKRKPGSGLILVGAAAATLPLLLAADIQFLLLGHVLLVFSILAALTRQIGRDKLDHQNALLSKAELEATKARLETELIKHSIQPHFLMNTLNALIDWVEESPNTGVAFIHELSRHFRILLKISGQREIPLGQEIELCRSLLAIMSYRMETEYRLVVEGVNLEDSIPPCSLHTLVENGVTHNEYAQSVVEFKLQGKIDSGERYYSLIVPMEGPEHSKASGEFQNGTGLRYVESRLEESYPGNWRLWNGVVEANWVSRIQLPLERSGKAVS